MIISKDSVFSVVMLVLVIVIANRLIPPSVDSVIAITLSKNKVGIKSIDQERDVSNTKEMMIDVVDLSRKNKFSHPVLGVLGWSDDFFADIITDFTVSKGGLYRFEVGSDDGYDLKVDGKSLCKFIKDRGYQTQICRVRLKEGEHNLELNYFQGYGHAGLTLKVSDGPKGELIFWGADSNAISYLPPKK